MPFKPGQSGNPGGRPKGARQKLAESFLTVLVNDFNANGADAINRVRQNDPSTYMRVIGQIIPKEITAEGGEPLFQNVTITFVKPEAKE